MDYIRIPEQLNVAKVTLAIFNGFVPQPTWDDQTREELYALCWAIETVKYILDSWQTWMWVWPSQLSRIFITSFKLNNLIEEILFVDVSHCEFYRRLLRQLKTAIWSTLLAFTSSWKQEKSASYVVFDVWLSTYSSAALY